MLLESTLKITLELNDVFILWIVYFHQQEGRSNFSVIVSGLQEAWDDDRAERSQMDGLKNHLPHLIVEEAEAQILWLVSSNRKVG